jgi:hypothetical protein
MHDYHHHHTREASSEFKGFAGSKPERPNGLVQLAQASLEFPGVASWLNF